MVDAWILWQEGLGPRPGSATRITDASIEADGEPGLIEEFTESAEALWTLGRELVGGTARAIANRLGSAGRMLDLVAPQLPRLSRLASIRSDTPVSPAAALQEKALQSGDACLLYTSPSPRDKRQSRMPSSA